MKDLKGKRIAILATSGFEESELFEPKESLEKSGAKVYIIAPEKGRIKAWNHGNWSRELDVDLTVDEARDMEFDALVLPGGVINPDKLRRDQKNIDFIKTFFEKNKPVAAICHGPWLLIEAEVVKGRTMTSFHSIKKDVINAGANWVDQEVVVDGNLITSRAPGDIPAFSNAIAEKV